MTRKQAIALLRVAGYHDDRRAFTRLYVEHRISFTAAQDAFKAGARARGAGVPCACPECKCACPACNGGRRP